MIGGARSGRELSKAANCERGELVALLGREREEVERKGLEKECGLVVVDDESTPWGNSACSSDCRETALCNADARLPLGPGGGKRSLEGGA